MITFEYLSTLYHQKSWVGKEGNRSQDFLAAYKQFLISRNQVTKEGIGSCMCVKGASAQCCLVVGESMDGLKRGGGV